MIAVAVTFKVIARLVMPETAAVILVVPTPTAVAKPVEEIVAAAGVSLAQVTWEVTAEYAVSE